MSSMYFYYMAITVPLFRKKVSLHLNKLEFPFIQGCCVIKDWYKLAYYGYGEDEHVKNLQANGQMNYGQQETSLELSVRDLLKPCTIKLILYG